jgi:antirestriction protein
MNEREPQAPTPEQLGVERQEVERHEHPRIYVASLADYNDGVLHGTWIDATGGLDDIHAAVDGMLASSPTTPRAEEYAIHDYEGFGRYRVDEYSSLDRVNRIARGIAEHGLAFSAWASTSEQDDALDGFEDAFLGSYESATDYAEQLLDDFGLEHIIEEYVPEGLQAYVRVDAEAFGHDLVLGGDIIVVEHDRGVYIFEG